MEIAADLALFRAERDALAFLGLLSSLHLRFDPPISCGDGDTAQPTHFQGLNIHALIVDNADGGFWHSNTIKFMHTKARLSTPSNEHCEWLLRE
jgi:hypothetical protein